MDVEEECHKGEVPVSLHPIKKYMVSAWFISDDGNVDPLFKVVSARFLHSPVTISLFPYSII